MANETNQFTLLKIICVAVGIIIGFVLVQGVLGFGGIIGGALGGGGGAVLGLGLYALASKITNKQ